ncbi:MAG: response regulator [Candidatus Dormibacteraeota bacterium]|nr:response regulator [Candidatus Dormibacteraeota bacterium]
MADAEDTHHSGDEVTVLYVEDDPMVAEMYRLKLELDGYRVVMAKDGLEGLRLAEECSPDLIFLDIRLPAMGGLEVLERLRESDRTRQVPVVILSNYGESDLVDRGLKLGALDYLIKSQTTPNHLSGSVQRWLREP